ncbi:MULTISPECIES: 4-hydroxy-tetrahydrodipicolinate synthase [Rhizobium]|uniref:4-hydroxy-tetrahydrodipicolinate synthase n=1 Tax=Rhizobium johnstonii (strain DSM 114642 / LMG 32736 / 3841) TaxID=216596 RepID=Q1MIA4_RHIJ3|nr:MULTISPECIES: 4-hydroxy-tetrahydrodipicolinate synthase [Rhizobium]MBB4511106.1 4-hydroxy-tetrahydrodipicolinate synthase [Rhizobium leguminosarum]MBY5373426.1 4-hydroxy-tetrahydrodipicolinate synthase [Rhizobium leguminosarum]MBY5388415.1 4-hydroxy-tetrahydrodipicolinate synthase [Rhizobium leguminosarum]MBY5429007.1 4-hydroxy-tetrahydrodipicolinate synthase [Rhizobium leguminosarum]NEH97743.1 4-hydroxy-tetrahydrodipicolinate synthase [Rhizobium leguminosarum]
MEMARMPRLGGAITALVTPFRHGGLDRPALRALAEWQILSGVDGLAVCSVTGEGPTLSPQERAEVIDLSIQSVTGRVPVIAATGTNSTESTIALTREAEALGAAAALVTVPYYSKPGQKGIIHHFEQVVAASGLPVIVDHAPAQTASDLSTKTLGSLAAIPGIVGIRDATGDIARFAGLSPILRQRFRFFSGHDPSALAFTIAGGDGAISPGANVLPRLFTSMQQAARAGNLSAARSLQDRLLPLISALGPEGDPARIKHALQLMRGLEAELRLPLVAVEPEMRFAIGKALAPFLDESSAGMGLSL